MRKTATLLVVASVLMTLAAGPAVAQSELDQSQTTVDGQYMTGGFPEQLKQTFTAHKTGTLDRVSIHVTCEQWTTCDPEVYGALPGFEVEIRGTRSDPNRTIGFVSQAGSHWYDLDLYPAPFVEAGKQYELVFYHAIGNASLGLGVAASDVYPGGELSSGVVIEGDGTGEGSPLWTAESDKDMAFETHVTPDTTAPRVDAVSPADGQKGVARGTNLKATFSEKMDPATIGASTFRLFKVNANGTTSRVTNASVTPSQDGLSATLDPYGASSTKLGAKTKYKAVVTTGAEDVAGNALDQDPATSGNQQKAWYFTTGSM